MSSDKKSKESHGISETKKGEMSKNLTHFNDFTVKPDDSDDSLPFKRAVDFDIRDSPVKGM